MAAEIARWHIVVKSYRRVTALPPSCHTSIFCNPAHCKSSKWQPGSPSTVEHYNKHRLNSKESKAFLGYCNETEFGGLGSSQGEIPVDSLFRGHSHHVTIEEGSRGVRWFYGGTGHLKVCRCMLLSSSRLPLTIDLAL